MKKYTVDEKEEKRDRLWELTSKYQRLIEDIASMFFALEFKELDEDEMSYIDEKLIATEKYAGILYERITTNNY